MGILIAATFTVALGVWAQAKFTNSLGGRNALWLWGLVLTLPLSAVVNLWIKAPILRSLRAALRVDRVETSWPWWFVAIVLLVVGVTEELIKLTPLLKNTILSHAKTPMGACAVAVAIGFGFGISEAMYLAWSWRHHPEIASVPFYKLFPFFGERLAVMFFHSAFLMLPLSQLSKGTWRFLIGLLAGMLVHALTDFPAALFKMKLLGGPAVSVMISLILFLMLWAFTRYLQYIRPVRSVAEQPGGRILYKRRLP